MLQQRLRNPESVSREIFSVRSLRWSMANCWPIRRMNSSSGVAKRCIGNTTAAARSLHLSVRAVSYRLERVHALTGYRAGHPAHHLPLLVAVTGARLLDWPRQPLPAGR